MLLHSNYHQVCHSLTGSRAVVKSIWNRQVLALTGTQPRIHQNVKIFSFRCFD